MNDVFSLSDKIVALWRKMSNFWVIRFTKFDRGFLKLKEEVRGEMNNYVFNI